MKAEDNPVWSNTKATGKKNSGQKPFKYEICPYNSIDASGKVAAFTNTHE